MYVKVLNYHCIDVESDTTMKFAIHLAHAYQNCDIIQAEDILTKCILKNQDHVELMIADCELMMEKEWKPNQFVTKFALQLSKHAVELKPDWLHAKVVHAKVLACSDAPLFETLKFINELPVPTKSLWVQRQKPLVLPIVEQTELDGKSVPKFMEYMWNDKCI